MRHLLLIAAVALAFSYALAPASGAPKKRAYKPAEQQETDEPKTPQDTTDPKAGPTYEQELQAAKEQRDKDLQDAAANETDRRKLDKRKQEILAQYARIVAAMRDKYEAQQPEDPTGSGQAPGKGKVGKPRPGDTADAAMGERDKPGKSKSRNRKGRDPADALAEAQQNLDEENNRHQDKLEQLNAQLEQAETSGKQQNVRKFQKAIEKENNAYDARKKILERRVRDLGGSTAPAPAPAPDATQPPAPAARNRENP